MNLVGTESTRISWRLMKRGLQAAKKELESRRATNRRAEAYASVRCSEAIETCMMNVDPHRECSGTMAETEAIVQWRR